MDSKQLLIEELNNSNWERAKEIIPLVEPMIEYFPTDKSTFSKFGGKPNLPTSIKWPTYNNQSMVFFAQIDLKDLKQFNDITKFPKQGMLFFFAHFKPPVNQFGAEYSFSPTKDEYQVLYYQDNVDKITKREFPKDLIDAYQFEEQKINFELNYQIPPSTETSKIEQLDLTDDEDWEYMELLEEIGIGDANILGIPFPLQYGVEYDWAFSYLETRDLKNPESREKIDLLRPQFINLLSFSLEEYFDVIGSSNVYFGILPEDLKNEQFENSILVLQGT